MSAARFNIRNLISNKNVRWLAYHFFVGLARLKLWTSLDANLEAPKSSLESLDAILSKADSFESFFSNATLRETYFNELRNYFGSEKFPRDAFDEICRQLQMINKVRPEFGRNLWTKPFDKNSFTISAFADSAGRSMNRNLWRIFWRGYCSELESQSYVMGDATLLEEKERIRAEIGRFADVVCSFKLSQVTPQTRKLSRKDKEFLDREFFRSATANPSFKKAVASMVGLFFALPENRQLIYLSDADLLLYYLRELRQNPHKILSVIPDCPNPEGLIGAIRHCLPDVKKLKADLNLFPFKMMKTRRGKHHPVGRTATSEFKTQQVHPIHAIWLGIPGNDCLAGHSKQMTPARWLVSVSEGSLSHVIEKDGAYQGFIRCTSVNDNLSNTYGSIEIWSPLVIKNILVADQERKLGLSIRPFFEVWFPLYMKKLPKTWRGVVLSESLLIDNLGTKSVIIESPFYRRSVSLGDAKGFVLTDQVANQIAAEHVSAEVRERYGAGVIFDARIQDAGLIRLLDAN